MPDPSSTLDAVARQCIHNNLFIYTIVMIADIAMYPLFFLRWRSYIPQIFLAVNLAVIVQAVLSLLTPDPFAQAMNSTQGVPLLLFSFLMAAIATVQATATQLMLAAAAGMMLVAYTIYLLMLRHQLHLDELGLGYEILLVIAISFVLLIPFWFLKHRYCGGSRTSSHMFDALTQSFVFSMFGAYAIKIMQYIDWSFDTRDICCQVTEMQRNCMLTFREADYYFWIGALVIRLSLTLWWNCATASVATHASRLPTEPYRGRWFCRLSCCRYMQEVDLCCCKTFICKSRSSASVATSIQTSEFFRLLAEGDEEAIAVFEREANKNKQTKVPIILTNHHANRGGL